MGVWMGGSVGVGVWEGELGKGGRVGMMSTRTWIWGMVESMVEKVVARFVAVVVVVMVVRLVAVVVTVVLIVVLVAVVGHVVEVGGEARWAQGRVGVRVAWGWGWGSRRRDVGHGRWVHCTHTPPMPHNCRGSGSNTSTSSWYRVVAVVVMVVGTSSWYKVGTSSWYKVVVV